MVVIGLESMCPRSTLFSSVLFHRGRRRVLRLFWPLSREVSLNIRKSITWNVYIIEGLRVIIVSYPTLSPLAVWNYEALWRPTTETERTVRDEISKPVEEIRAILVFASPFRLRDGGPSRGKLPTSRMRAHCSLKVKKNLYQGHERIPDKPRSYLKWSWNGIAV